MHIPPPLLALAAALAQRAIAREARPLTPVRVVGATSIAAGAAALPTAAMRRFRGVGTTVDPMHPENASTLVTTGPFTVTRNPMYVGLTGLLVANAVRQGSWAALLPVAGFVALMDRTQVAAEEAALSARFGAEYDAYRAAAPRWLDRRSLDLGGL